MRWLRLDLEPWRDTQAAREVDEELAAVGSARERSERRGTGRALPVTSLETNTAQSVPLAA
jgi:hypothetical protein